jgi:hypothetical protein
MTLRFWDHLTGRFNDRRNALYDHCRRQQKAGALQRLDARLSAARALSETPIWIQIPLTRRQRL